VVLIAIFLLFWWVGVVIRTFFFFFYCIVLEIILLFVFLYVEVDAKEHCQELREKSVLFIQMDGCQFVCIRIQI
jgi:hypothetical protein